MFCIFGGNGFATINSHKELDVFDEAEKQFNGLQYVGCCCICFAFWKT